MIVILDNYDSFTYNLFQFFGQLGQTLKVFRNDEVTIEQLRRLPMSHMVISPGPGRPEAAGISCAAVEAFCDRVPILGVCLGHQCIAEVFGGRVIHGRRPVHGKTAAMQHNGRSVFAGLPDPLTVTRYHSLTVDPQSVPRELQVTATSDEGDIMAVEHVRYPVVGLQFHPESIFTQRGLDILANFLQLSVGGGAVRADASTF